MKLPDNLVVQNKVNSPDYVRLHPCYYTGSPADLSTSRHITPDSKFLAWLRNQLGIASFIN